MGIDMAFQFHWPVFGIFSFSEIAQFQDCNWIVPEASSVENYWEKEFLFQIIPYFHFVESSQ